jgi:hypothetical protein
VLAPRAAILLLVIVAAGCGESSVPDGEPFSVRFEAFQNPIFGVPNVTTTQAQPFAVYETDPDWGKVSRLLPERLPEPLDQGSECRAGHIVSVRMSSGGDVDYGPCRWPEEIIPVRLLMRTLQQRELAAERRCDCP